MSVSGPNGGRVSAQEGVVSARGVSASGPGSGLVYPSIHWADTLLVNRITDTCKNITLPNFVAGGK